MGEPNKKLWIGNLSYKVLDFMLTFSGSKRRS